MKLPALPRRASFIPLEMAELAEALAKASDDLVSGQPVSRISSAIPIFSNETRVCLAFGLQKPVFGIRLAGTNVANEGLFTSV